MNNPVKSIKNKYHLMQSVLANLRYGFPGKNLTLIGVTGTDGKTTTTSLIYHILHKSGLPVGYISTIKAKIGDKELDTGLHVTTPDPWDVPKYLRLMKQAKIKYVVVEATSQGLSQNRLWSLIFDTSVITNIKHDHLDYHGTWEDYAQAKYKLIENTKQKGIVVLNKDDSESYNWLKTQIVQLDRNFEWITKQDVKLTKHDFNGMHFTYLDTDFYVNLIGLYNLENVLAAINICKQYVSLKQISLALKDFVTPKGRMDIMQVEPTTIIIDFAHTPHALESALQTIKKLKKPSSRIITVFGCAGERDKNRRDMGIVSSKFADVTILTAEDPRSEKLKHVNDEILQRTASERAFEIVSRFSNAEDYYNADKQQIAASIEKVATNGEHPFVVFDEDSNYSRQNAIDLAIKLAKVGDIVFITGKAHEQSLCFGNIEYPWSDHDTVTTVLANNKR